MKSKFLKLCSMLLCGVMLAAVGCTDQLKEDISNVAGDVDAVEATLAELQSKYNALEKAQNDLEAVVALKTDVAALQTTVATLASKSDVEAVSAEVAALKKSLETVEANLAKYATTDDLKAAVATLAKAEDVAALQAALKTVNETLTGLATKIEAAEKEISALKTAQTALEASVKTVLAKLEGVDFKAFMTAADVKAYIDANVKPADLSGLATSKELAAATEQIKAAEAAIANVNAILGTLIGELQKRPQSLVFVPEFSDMAISAYEYTIGEMSVNNTVTVKGTYKVSPANTVALVGETLSPVMLVKALKPADTRSADYADGVMGELVSVSNVDARTGTFDVEFVFASKEFAENETAIALYLSEGEYTVSPLTTEDEMAVETPSMLSNCISSEYVPVAFSENTNLADMFAFVKDGKKYVAKADKFGWDVVKAVTPLEGYEVMLEFAKGEFTTLADAAVMLNVDVEDITPKYTDATTFYVNGAVEKDKNNKNNCAVQVVTPNAASKGEIAVRTYSVDKAPIVLADAGKYVGHKVVTEGNFYFDIEKNQKLVVIPEVNYSYEIDYRTAKLALQNGPDKVEWNLVNAKKLSSSFDFDGAYSEPINEKFDVKFSEYDVVVIENNAADVIDYAAVINNVNAQFERVVTVAGKAVENAPVLTIIPSTTILHDIAAVSVADYAFDKVEKTYDFVNTYTVGEGLWTKVEYNYSLTLGAKPEKIAVETKALELPYSISGYTKAKAVDFQTLVYNAFNAYLPAEYAKTKKYDAFAEAIITSSTQLFDSKGKTVTGQTGSSFDITTGDFTLSANDMETIYLNKKANSAGYAVRSLTTWYDVVFEYTLPFSVVEPQYSLTLLTPYTTTDAQGNRYAPLNYIYVGPETDLTYTVENADIAHYFKVNGADDNNDVTVEFSLVYPDHGTTAKPAPCIQHGEVEVTKAVFEATKANKGELTPGEYVISWGDYKHKEITLKATLKVNGNTFATKSLKLVAPNPLTIASAYAAKTSVVPHTETSYNVLDAVNVSIIDREKTIAASDFVVGKGRLSADTYGATFTTDWTKVKVYYLDGTTKVDVPVKWYTTAGSTITLSKEAADLQTNLYAEVPVAMAYCLDEAQPVKTNVTVTFAPAEKK